MWAKIKQGIWRALRYLGRVMLIVAILLLGVGASFLFTGGLAFQAYSDRLLWVGMITSLVGGLAAVGLNAKERVEKAAPFQVPSAAEEEPPAEKEAPPVFPKKDAFRYELVFRFWLIGAICIALSALVSILGG